MTRTIVLLGAGASRDAGLPLTSQLAQILVAKLGETWPNRAEVATLNFVYSQMIGHHGEDGSSPLRDVNIETLISAVRLLQHRDTHEVAPFVSAWKPGTLGFGSSARPLGYASDLERAVNKAIDERYPNGNDLAAVIANIARDAVAQADASVFESLEGMLLDALRSELSSLGNTSYLLPLADLARSQEGGLDVVTLNYDLAVETMAADAGVTVDRGIDRWIAGAPLTFEHRDDTINLLKVHGSVDWELRHPHPHSVHPPQIEIVADEPAWDPDDPQRPPVQPPGRPWIVVGDREKLATDGPTLDLLNAAGSAFADAQRLVVVGYSFTDAHVNAIIRNWMAADSTRTFTVVDPGWPRYGASDVRGQLARAYGGSYVYGAAPFPRRIAVLTESASTGLQAGLTMEPIDPEPYATAEWGPSGDEILVTLHGTSLDGASVSGSSGNRMIQVLSSREERQQIIDRLGPPRPPGQSAYTERLEQGDTFIVYPILSREMQTVELLLEGDDRLGTRHVDLPPLEVPPMRQPGGA